MDSNEVEKQINSDLEKFENEVYKGKVDVPENILDLFRNGIEALPPQTHGTHFTKVKVISSKQSDELTIGEISLIIRIIVCTPFGVTYSDIYSQHELMGSPEKAFDEATGEQIKFEKFILSFNGFVHEFQQRLAMKKANLLSLTSGINGNPMRRVPNN